MLYDGKDTLCINCGFRYYRKEIQNLKPSRLTEELRLYYRVWSLRSQGNKYKKIAKILGLTMDELRYIITGKI